MTPLRIAQSEERDYWVLRHIASKPDTNQRELAQELGLSLGAVNYCLKALIAKGWVKVENFSHSSNKLGYVYLLTPVGVAEKLALTLRFVQRKRQEYALLQAEVRGMEEDSEKSERSLTSSNKDADEVANGAR